MMIQRLIILLSISVFAISTGEIAFPSNAEQFPQEFVTFYVPYSEGGATDGWGRAMAAELAGKGWDIKTSNVLGGAAGSLCHDTLWYMDHTGYNIGIFNETNLFVPAFTGINITANDWDYYIAAGAPTVLCVNAYSGIENMDDFTDTWVEGDISLSSPSGGVFLLFAELFEYSTGASMDILMYDGMMNAVSSCAAGETYAVVASTSTVVEYVKSGDLIPIAVFSDEDYYNQDFSTVPAITDYIPEMQKYLSMKQFYGLMIPSDVPQDVKKQIEKDFIEICQSESVNEFASANYMEIYCLTGDEAKGICIESQKLYVQMLYDLGFTDYSPADLGLD